MNTIFQYSFYRRTLVVDEVLHIYGVKFIIDSKCGGNVQESGRIKGPIGSHFKLAVPYTD